MPFGLGPVETIFLLIFGLLFYVVPIGAAIWGLITLARLHTGQQELIARVAALERALSGRP